jgi:hypothetical protein
VQLDPLRGFFLGGGGGFLRHLRALGIAIVFVLVESINSLGVIGERKRASCPS